MPRYLQPCSLAKCLKESHCRQIEMVRAACHWGLGLQTWAGVWDATLAAPTTCPRGSQPDNCDGYLDCECTVTQQLYKV